MNQEELNNTDEILSEEDLKLRRMLKRLENVSAPNDFEFRLKNRIANANTNNKSSYVWAWRVVLPVLVLGIMFAAFFALSSDYGSNVDLGKVPPVPQVSDTNSLVNKNEIAETTPAPTVSFESNPVQTNQLSPEIPKNEVAQSNSKPSKTERKSTVNQDLPDGSKDFGVNIERPIQPNFIPNTNSQTLKIPENNSSISARDILLQIGISVESENGKLVVKSLSANGFGKASGIREGDVIESIDNQKITPNTVFKNSVEAKTIVVLRNNVRQTITLKN